MEFLDNKSNNKSYICPETRKKYNIKFGELLQLASGHNVQIDLSAFQDFLLNQICLPQISYNKTELQDLLTELEKYNIPKFPMRLHTKNSPNQKPQNINQQQQNFFNSKKEAEAATKKPNYKISLEESQKNDDSSFINKNESSIGPDPNQYSKMMFNDSYLHQTSLTMNNKLKKDHKTETKQYQINTREEEEARNDQTKMYSDNSSDSRFKQINGNNERDTNDIFLKMQHKSTTIHSNSREIHEELKDEVSIHNLIDGYKLLSDNSIIISKKPKLSIQNMNSNQITNKKEIESQEIIFHRRSQYNEFNLKNLSEVEIIDNFISFIEKVPKNHHRLIKMNIFSNYMLKEFSNSSRDETKLFTRFISRFPQIIDFQALKKLGFPGKLDNKWFFIEAVFDNSLWNLHIFDIENIITESEMVILASIVNEFINEEFWSRSRNINEFSLYNKSNTKWLKVDYYDKFEDNTIYKVFRIMENFMNELY